MDENDVWWISFSFPFNITVTNADKKVQEWMRRLRQALHLKEEDFLYELIFDRQVREVVHAHMILVADRLRTLDVDKWQSKWIDIADGTSKIIPVGEDLAYKPSAIASYMIARHSNEIRYNLHIGGCRS
jgi:hypothetical protein